MENELIYRGSVKTKVSDMWWGEIDSIPAVDAVEVRHGEWDDSSVAFYRKCSECGCCVEWDKQPFLFGIGEYNFCPNCGAKMDGGENEK